MSSQPRRFGFTPAQQVRVEPDQPSTILVVDDEESVRIFVERVLQKAGYATAAAASGPEALRLAAGLSSVDLLITDMMMPEMTGDEVARRLRQDHPAMKVLYFTGFSDKLFDKKGTLWQDEAFVDKPCSVKGLLEAVSLLWSQRLVSAPIAQTVKTAGEPAPQPHKEESHETHPARG